MCKHGLLKRVTRVIFILQLSSRGMVCHYNEVLKSRQGGDEAMCYRKNTGDARHVFLTECGIHNYDQPFARSSDYGINIGFKIGSLMVLIN